MMIKQKKHEILNKSQINKEKVHVFCFISEKDYKKMSKVLWNLKSPDPFTNVCTSNGHNPISICSVDINVS